MPEKFQIWRKWNYLTSSVIQLINYEKDQKVFSSSLKNYEEEKSIT